jgi:hypothetical protein
MKERKYESTEERKKKEGKKKRKKQVNTPGLDVLQHHSVYT